jgi:protoporphyrinogen oxidase
MPEKTILILGSGPTGIGAAANLFQSGNRTWKLFETTDRIGGLAGSETDNLGFTWDRAGHVLFSKDPQFNQLLQSTFNGNLNSLERKSFIRMGSRWVAYPFQNNIGQLETAEKEECLQTLKQAKPSIGAKNFEEWIVGQFGTGISRLFMLPYNRKVWAFPLEKMGIYWMADRVSVVDYEKIAAAAASKKVEANWGPNARFFYPRGKGFGSLFEQWSQPFRDQLSFNRGAVSIDPEKRAVTLSDGSVERYDFLISSMPLDRLVSLMPSAPNSVREAAKRLAFHGVYAVGIGLNKKIETDFCWAYFPDPEIPFYRVTHLSKYSPQNVPDSDTNRYSSFLCEVPYSSSWPNAKATVVERCLTGLISSGIFAESDRASVVSRHLIDCPYAYPIPTLDRNSALTEIQSWLEQKNIMSRGRFGTWRYEIGNSDHAFMMGWEASGRLLEGRAETTFNSA